MLYMGEWFNSQSNEEVAKLVTGVIYRGYENRDYRTSVELSDQLRESNGVVVCHIALGRFLTTHAFPRRRRSVNGKLTNQWAVLFVRQGPSADQVTDAFGVVGKSRESLVVMRPGDWTYLVSDGQKHKIGRSKNPEQRVAALRTANPGCILVAKTQRVTERAMHVLFREKRLDREWFRLSPTDLDRVLALFGTGVDESKQPLLAHHFRRHRKEKGYSSYTIPFGMHRGTKLTTMVSADQVSYLEWFVNKPHSQTEQKQAPYAAFRWWLNELRKTDGNESTSIEEEIEVRKQREARTELSKAFWTDVSVAA